MVVLSIAGTAHHFYVAFKFYSASGYSYSEVKTLLFEPKQKNNIATIDLYLSRYFWNSFTQMWELSFTVSAYTIFSQIVKYSNTIIDLDDKLNTAKQKQA